MSLTAYTTAAKMQIQLSATGVSLRSDHDAGAVTQAILDASAIVNRYAQVRYTAAALAASDEIEQLARDIALYRLCIYRNNPAPKPVQDAYDEALKELDMIRRGVINLADAPLRAGNFPVLSNQKVRQDPFSRVVTVEGKSTSMPQTGYVAQNDRTDGFDYSI